MANEKKQISILLVEDDPGDQKLIKTAILCRDHELGLNIASSGESALAYLAKTKTEPEQHSRPNLILLDLNMPGMGGKEFLRKIKVDDDFCSIPVVVVTTSDSETDIQECYALHAAGYIQKSAMPDEFSQVLEKLTRYWFSVSAILQE
ncbi:MAG: response regulator [Phycisphaerae bacterium]|nr:response regulator [Phycisphaerae bacterium]